MNGFQFENMMYNLWSISQKDVFHTDSIVETVYGIANSNMRTTIVLHLEVNR